MSQNFSDMARPLSDATDHSPDAVGAKALELLRQESTRELLQPQPVRQPATVAPNRVLNALDNKSYLQTWINAGTSKLISDDDTRSTVNHLAADFVKTASLFTGGKLGLASTFVAYGLDQARPADSWKEQAADFALGGVKGESMKGMFSVIGSTGANAPLKGALMGLGAGACDEVFKRQTFTDPASLNDRLRKNAFNPQAVLLNAATFTAGEGLYSGIDLATKGALSENRLVSGMVMGGSFGFVNGTVAEASRELQEKGSLNPGKVLWHGLLDGSVSAAGAGVGIKISDPVFQQKVKNSALDALDSLGLSRNPASRDLPNSQVRPDMLIEDDDAAGLVRRGKANDSKSVVTDADLAEVERKLNSRTALDKDSTPEADYGVEKRQVDDSIADRFETAARQKRMQHLVDAFETETTKRGFDADDKALFYKQLNRLLSDNPEAMLTEKQRADLAEQVINHSAFPTTVDQGKNRTCNVTTIEHRLYANDPDVVAKMVADLAETGKFVTAKGRTIDLAASASGIKPDLESARSLARQRSARPGDPDSAIDLDWASQAVKKDGGRDWASQLAETTMVKIAWLDRVRFLSGDLMLGTNRTFFNSSREMVMSTDPDAFQPIYNQAGKMVQSRTVPKEAYNEEHKLITDYDPGSVVYRSDGRIAGIVSPDKLQNVFDESGKPVLKLLKQGDSGFDAEHNEILYRTRPGELTYDKMIAGNDGKNPVRECIHYDRDGKVTILRKDNGEQILGPQLHASQLYDIHTEVTGRKDPPFVVVPGDKYAEQRNVIVVKTDADLARALEFLQEKDNYPGVIHVHTSNAPWSKKPGGGHVINLQGYDADAEMVHVTNQWGSKEDAAHGNLPLDVMLAAMQNPPEPKPGEKPVPAPEPKPGEKTLPAPAPTPEPKPMSAAQLKALLAPKRPQLQRTSAGLITPTA